MSEKEIRGILQEVCAELDRRVRDAVRQGVRKVLLPTALGAGLALTPGCESERSTPSSDAIAQVDGGSQPQADSGRLDSGAIPPYMAPDRDMGGPQPDYMAPEPDGGPIPPYMAPDAGGIDTGPVLEYMAPDPDAGPVPPYMAPDDAGAVLDGMATLYSAPMPTDLGPVDQGIDSGPQLDYMAPDPS